jgi:hypothetical protein
MQVRSFASHRFGNLTPDCIMQDEIEMRLLAFDLPAQLTPRAKLDALHFILYGIWDAANPAQSRDDIRYIYSTFPIVEREERARYAGCYRSTDLALLWINALLAGQPDADIRD